MKARHCMCALLAAFTHTNYMQWIGMVGPLMSIILEQHSKSWHPAHVAILLSAFSTGYVPVQVPFALLARQIGAKVLTTANLCFQTVALALLPAAVRAGALPLSALYFTMGMMQGSRIACNATLEGRFIPDGLERVGVYQVMTWFGRGVSIANSFLVPFVAGRFGWRYIPRWYAVQSGLMAILWQLWAAETPAQWRGPVTMDAEELQLLEDIGKERAAEETEAGTTADEKGGHPSSPAVDVDAGPISQLRDADLPPLSIRQMLQIPKIRGMLAISVVTALFPVMPFGALESIYFSERYNMPLVRATYIIATACSPMDGPCTLRDLKVNDLAPSDTECA